MAIGIHSDGAAPALDSLDNVLEGAAVMVQNLLKATSLNGKIGTLTKFVKGSGRYGICLVHDGETKEYALRPMNFSILSGGVENQKYFSMPEVSSGSLNHSFPPEDAILDWLKTDEAQYYLDDFYPDDPNEIAYEHKIVAKWYARVSEFRGDPEDDNFTIQKNIKSQLLEKVGMWGLAQNLRIVEGLSCSHVFFGNRMAADDMTVYMRMVGPDELWYEDKDNLDDFLQTNWVARHPYPARNTITAWLESFDAADYFSSVQVHADYYDHDGMRRIYETREKSIAKAVGENISNNGGFAAMQTNWYVLSAICSLRIPAFFGERARRGRGVCYLPIELKYWWEGIGNWHC